MNNSRIYNSSSIFTAAQDDNISRQLQRRYNQSVSLSMSGSHYQGTQQQDCKFLSLKEEEVKIPRTGPFESMKNEDSDNYHFTQVIVDHCGMQQPLTR